MRVVDAESGRPIAGAVVTAVASEVMAVADSAGVSLVPLAGRDRRVKVTAAGYVSADVMARVDSLTVGVYRDLIRVLRGRVIEASTDRPLTSAIVTVEGDTAIESGLDGGFERIGLRAGDQRLVARLDGFTADSGLARVRGGETAAVVLRLRDTASIGQVEGTVTDRATGRALPGARLAVKDGAAAVVTDDDGHYRLHGIPAGEHWLVASAPGYQSQMIRFRALKGWTVTVSFRLPGQP